MISLVLDHLWQSSLFLAAAGLITLALSHNSAGARFWLWFQANDSALSTVQTAREEIASELARELHRIHPDLTFEFGPSENGVRDFVVSADGSREAFPAVIALGHAAPAMAHWRVIMFRPPRPDVTQIRIGDIELDAKTVEFIAEPDGPLTGLTLSIPGYKATPHKVYEQAAYILLDGMLGEYTVETRVGFIELTLPANRRPGKWRPLTAIQEAVSAQAPP